MYPKLFKDIFGYEDTTSLPNIVMVRDDLRGFVSAVQIDKTTLYLLWGGSLDGFKAARKCWSDGEQFLKEQGIEYVTTKTPQDNTVWQRMLLGLGWMVSGVHWSGGRFQIELFKNIKEL